MKQLFNNENRIAVILKNIEMQSVCSVESLAAKLDVSQKTIRNDIKELNCLLGGYACISNNKGTCKLIVFARKVLQKSAIRFTSRKTFLIQVIQEWHICSGS